MKPVTILLSASTVALAVASIYLGRELAAARAEADDAARLASYLGARVTELQRERATIAAAPPIPGAPPPRAGSSASVAPAAVAASDAQAQQQQEMAAAARRAFAQRMQSPAMQRALRAQLRTGAKRMYADFAAEYDLTPEEASALYDLIARQQSAPDEIELTDPEANAARHREREQKFDRDVAALLGENRAARLRDYQGTFEARGQIASLEEQLAGVDLPLDTSQRQRLIKAAIQDAEQFPMPAFAPNLSPEQIAQAYRDWQRDRAERIANAARGILTPRQMQHYDDLREAQRAYEDPAASN